MHSWELWWTCLGTINRESSVLLNSAVATSLRRLFESSNTYPWVHTLDWAIPSREWMISFGLSNNPGSTSPSAFIYLAFSKPCMESETAGG
jgi:hypothetical protein